MGVSENRGPKYGTLNSRIPKKIKGPPQIKATLIYGNSHMVPGGCRDAAGGFRDAGPQTTCTWVVL